jgi:methylated-DNA-protein-cysteine methyltransferase-like protein
MSNENFFERVYAVAREIPWESHLWRYCKSFRNSRSARMVGWAMNAHIIGMMFPHRVVNRNGLLTGKFHFDGTNLMQQLLESEVVEESNCRILRNIFGTRNRDLGFN